MNKTVDSPLFAGAALLAVLALGGCEDVSTELKAPTYKTGIAATETRISAFKAAFPQQHASYMKNDEDKVMTEYKGSVPYHKNDGVNPLPKGFKHAQPYLKNLWLGYPFMYEYNETRGHTHAVEDLSILIASTALARTARATCPPPAGTAKRRA